MSKTMFKTDMQDLLQEIDEELNEFAGAFPLQKFKLGDYKQHPFITLLTCSDARVPGTIIGPMFNRVFSVENIGNQVPTSAGSLLYGILHLGTPLLVICGHSDCGAIKAASQDYSSEPKEIKNELNTVKKSLDQGLKGFQGKLPIDEVKYFTALAELNVDIQVEYLTDKPEIKELIHSKKLLILGMILDLHNAYGGGYGLTYLCNANGEREPQKLDLPVKLLARAKRLTS